MNEVINHVDLYMPGGWFDAVVVAFSVVAALSLWRVAGMPFAATSAASAFAGFVLVGNVAIPVFVAAVAAGLHLYARTGRRVDAGGRDLSRQAALIALGYIAYEVARIVSEGPLDDALANADGLIAVERGLGLLIEHDIQQLFLGHQSVLEAFNTVYSFLFLATVVAAVLWLFPVDRPNFIVLRNGLGVSALLAALTIAAFPVAPPRLVPEVGLVDTVVALGRQHDFVNEYAAMPSLHVGWMALVGYALGRSIGGRRGVVVGLAPGSVMGLTVMVTGNHYWVDGAVGAAYSLAPAWLTAHPSWTRRRMREVAAAGSAVHGHLVRGGAIMWESWRGRFTLVGLTGLLGYLVAGDIIRPGFTDYWGYLVLQMTVTLALLTAGEMVFHEQGGLSWVTHAIAVSTGYADVFGTAGDLYARIDEYDKITHFFGTAAVTAGVYDILGGLYRRGGASWWANERMKAAALIGFACGVAWEVWELIGDRLLHTSRIGGWWDTTNDLFSDAAGALFIVILLRAVERVEAPPAPEIPPGETASS